MWQEMIHLEVSLLREHQKRTKHDVSLVSEATGNPKRLLQLQLYCRNQGIEKELFESACSYLIDYWPRFFPEFSLLEAFYHFSDANDFTLTLTYRQNKRATKEITKQVKEKVANLFSICMREVEEENEDKKTIAKHNLKKSKMKASQSKDSKTITKEHDFTEKPSEEERFLLNEVWEEKFTLLAKDFILLKKQLAGTESDNEELHKEIQRQQELITTLNQQLAEKKES